MKKVLSCIFSFFFLLHFFFPGFPVQAKSQADNKKSKENLKIGNIFIINNNIFDTNEERFSGFPYIFINKLHIKTKKSFIQRELLFKTGDNYYPELIEESERNLRRYSFLKSVKIKPEFRDDHKVDISVITEDQWTTGLDIRFKKFKGYSEYGIYLHESNFLGLGRKFNIGYKHTTEKNLGELTYEDPHFLSSRWTLKGNFQETSDGKLKSAQLTYPFYSLLTDWSYGASFYDEKSVDRLYYEGNLGIEIPFQKTEGNVFLARAWGLRKSKKKIWFSLSYYRKHFPEKSRILEPFYYQNLKPTERETIILNSTFTLDKFSYQKETFIDKFGRIEDLPIGSSWKVTLGRADRFFGSKDKYNFLSAEYINFSRFGLNKFLVLKGKVETRFTEEELNNTLFKAFVHCYFKGFSHQTIAFNLMSEFTNKMDQPFQLSLGENNGLRGYSFKRFNGQKKILINLEDRIFTSIKIYTVALGFAVFFDAGYVWEENEKIDLSDLKSSVGVGIRLGLTKSSGSKVIRIDFAYPLDGGGRFSVSFSSGQIFSIL
ncbi:MAG: BamA/TamA family outer membrane protein [Candidatus Aminicenantia bacterium]